MSVHIKKFIKITLISLTIFTPKVIYAEDQYNKNSKATFSVTDNGIDPEIGTLVLKQIPDFDFGTLNEKTIYSGVTDKTAQNDGIVIVRDTRLGQTSWTLSVSMEKFTNGTIELDDVELSLSGKGSLGENLSGTITDQNIPTELVKSNNTHGTNEFLITKNNSKLSIHPNKKLELKEQNKSFTTTLHWNLSSEQPIAPPA